MISRQSFRSRKFTSLENQYSETNNQKNLQNNQKKGGGKERKKKRTKLRYCARIALPQVHAGPRGCRVHQTVKLRSVPDMKFKSNFTPAACILKVRTRDVYGRIGYTKFYISVQCQVLYFVAYRTHFLSIKYC